LGFEKLSPDQQSLVVPICIERIDRDGRDIAWGWFEAVEKVQEPLRKLAWSWPQDVWRVSELAETSVHTLWYRHRENLGLRPASRVLAEARWYARDLQAGTWQRRKGVVVALNGLDALMQANALTDPAKYEKLYQKELYFKALSEQLEDAGQPDVSQMLKFMRDGCTWPEIGQQLGRDPDAARMKFYRWLDRILPGRLKSSARKPREYR
jgi:hypothetical protein